MAKSDGRPGSSQASGDLPLSIPAMPTVPVDEIYSGRPDLLVEGLSHSVGWQDARKEGPSFVVTARQAGIVRVLQRFPLSERGWADAWRALSRLDADAAATVAARLDELEARRHAVGALAALDSRSLFYLRNLTFDGGSDSRSLAKGQHYDLRFQDDRIMVCAERSASALVELPYENVEAVEVSGRAGQAAGVALGWISGLGLAGAFFGFLIFGVVGLILGAVVLGLLGGLIAAGTNLDETILRVRGLDAEFQFLDRVRRPDDVRRALSEPLIAIRKANAAQAGSANVPAPPSDSTADQLSKLASLLQRDLITRDEFERLKADVITKL